MESIENFDLSELKISRDKLRSTILENHIHLMNRALLRSEESLVLSIREVSQSLELMEGCIT